MAKKPGVDIQVKHQRRDPKTGKHYDLEGLVEFAVGGNKLNTDYLRESYMDRSMKGTMKWTEENLKNLMKVKIAAQKALAEGRTQMPSNIEGGGRSIPKDPAQVLADIESIEDPSAMKNFQQWNKFAKMIERKGWEMGHSALSVATAQTAIYLSANKRNPLGGSADSPAQLQFREELRQLYLAQKALDSVVQSEWETLGKPTKLQGGDVEFVLSKLDALEDGFDITTDITRDMDILAGKAGMNGSIEMEAKDFNRWKRNVGAALSARVRKIWGEQLASKVGEEITAGYGPAYTRGSKTMVEVLERQFVDLVVKGKVKKYADKIHSTRKIGSKVKGVKKAKTQARNMGKKLKNAAADLAKVTLPNQSGQRNAGAGAGSQQADLQLLTLLKAKLPQTVAQNMGPPGLEYRTGRFASSVKPTDVVRTAQGYPSVGYTYQRNPYQVFEMGTGDSRWATTDRDPRKVIDLSIREIAAQLVVGRLYTRRV
jgi:hypothetical protein